MHVRGKEMVVAGTGRGSRLMIIVSRNINGDNISIPAIVVIIPLIVTLRIRLDPI